MKKIIFFIIVVVGLIFIVKMSNQDNKQSIASIAGDALGIEPISHASMILNWDNAVIYTDPVGAKMFTNKPAPDIILLTDMHGDHLDLKALEAVVKDKTVIIAPMAVADMLPGTLAGTLLVMKNGERTNQKTSQKINLRNFNVEAIPMYNLPEQADNYHTKGRGNGYVIEKNGTRIYISGDTAGISEMRNLRNVDIAFVAMNLPYTMGVEEAADAVLQFKPKKVYPYHYRTPEGFSDVAKFKEIINSENTAIEVVQLEWYPQPL